MKLTPLMQKEFRRVIKAIKKHVNDFIEERVVEGHSMLWLTARCGGFLADLYEQELFFDFLLYDYPDEIAIKIKPLAGDEWIEMSFKITVRSKPCPRRWREIGEKWEVSQWSQT